MLSIGEASDYPQLRIQSLFCRSRRTSPQPSLERLPAQLILPPRYNQRGYAVVDHIYQTATNTREMVDAEYQRHANYSPGASSVFTSQGIITCLKIRGSGHTPT